jgi:hypothetical protein
MLERRDRVQDLPLQRILKTECSDSMQGSLPSGENSGSQMEHASFACFDEHERRVGICRGCRIAFV